MNTISICRALRSARRATYRPAVALLLAVGGIAAAAAPASAFAPFTSGFGPPFLAGDVQDSVAADFDHDGHVDLAVLAGGELSVRYAEDFSTGVHFSGSGPDRAVPSASGHLELGDFNGDGRPDVAVAGPDSDVVSIFLTDAQGAPAAVPLTFESTAGVTDFVALDLNRDSVPDLVTLDAGQQSASVYINNGDGTFALSRMVPSYTSATSIVSGDFDGDGNVDFAIGNSSYTFLTFDLSDGAGHLTGRVNFLPNVPYDPDVPSAESRRTPEWLAAGDVDGDGIDDIIIGDPKLGTVFTATLKTGEFDNGAILDIGPPFQVGSLSGLVSTDLNGDGIADVVTADAAGDNATVLLGDGAGGFYDQGPIYVSPTTALSVGDIDSDGNPDLVAARHNGDSIVLLNRYDRAPTAADARYDVPDNQPSTFYLHADDLDGDPLGYEIVDPPTEPLTCDGETGRCTYSPGIYDGTDHFTFRAKDPLGRSVIGKATITVHHTPLPPIVTPVTSIDFAPTLTQTTATKHYSVRNDGDPALKLSAVTTSGAPFGVTAPDLSDVAPGATRTFTVTYRPTEPGDQEGTLTLASNGYRAPLTVPLSGSGVGATLTATPSSLAFGDIAVGPAVKKTVTVKNTGTATENGLTAAFTGTGAARFAVSGSLAALAPGASRTLTVTFTPQSRGAAAAALVLESSATGSAPPLTVPLSARGVAPVGTLSASALAFGAVKVGKTATKTVTVKNTGEKTLTFSSVKVTGSKAAAYKVTGSTASLAPGASRTFTVVFKPTAKGSAPAAVQLATNSVPSVPSVTVSGSGS